MLKNRVIFAYFFTWIVLKLVDILGLESIKYLVTFLLLLLVWNILLKFKFFDRIIPFSIGIVVIVLLIVLTIVVVPLIV